METLCRLSYRGKPDQRTRSRSGSQKRRLDQGPPASVLQNTVSSVSLVRTPSGHSPGSQPHATDSLSAREARRIFLHAQGLGTPRPRASARPAGQTQAAAAQYLATQGVLQLDTVNVLARAHHMPLYSRRGAYDIAAAEDYWWGDHDAHSPHVFEHWGHEASVMPMELLPAMHCRMISESTWSRRVKDKLESERPGLLANVKAYVADVGPVTASQVEHLSPRVKPRGSWWDASHVKDALEWLFVMGELAASRGKNFSRTYASTERAWGLPAASEGHWGLSPSQGRQELFDRGVAACGIGTVKDICDHFRLPYAPSQNDASIAGGKVWAESAVERGLATWVRVEGWDEQALLAVGEPSQATPWHRAAVDPGKATGAALLSPFDPVAWFRPRLERMFGMEYRIEIYTPEPKRLYGYYCLPLLVGDQVVGRVDLKADRKNSTLLVQSAWREDKAVAGVRRLSDERITAALEKELTVMAAWLGLENTTWTGKGTVPLPVHV